MTEDRTRLKAIELLRDHLGLDKDPLDSTTVKELNVDGLDLIEVGMALEAEFGVTIPDQVIAEWRTVGEILDWLTSRANVG